MTTPVKKHEAAHEGRMWSIQNHEIWATLSKSARLVYAALDSFFRKQSECWPSYRALKEKAGIKSDATISKALKELEDAGLIDKEKTKKGQRGRYYKSNRYLQSSLFNKEVGQTSTKNEEPPLQNIRGSSSKNEEEPLQKMKTNNNIKNWNKYNSEKQQLADALLEMKVDKKKIEEALDNYEPDYIKARIERARSKDNPAGYFVSILDKEITPSKEEIVRKNEEDKKREDDMAWKKQKAEFARRDRELKEEKAEDEKLDRIYEGLDREKKTEVDRRTEEMKEPGDFATPEHVRRRMAVQEFVEDGKIMPRSPAI